MVNRAGGASSFFSAPSDTLDPHLFDDEEQLRPEVAYYILGTLDEFMADHGFHDPGSWLHVWLAGSGITYQWAANRGNGDLDVLFGIHHGVFATANPDYREWSEDDLAAEFNEKLKADLWPLTANHDFGGQKYDVTFFMNPGTGTDITKIHPYAAYDVVSNQWTVRPPDVAADPRSAYPSDWARKAQADKGYTDSIIRRYNQFSDALNSSQPGSPGWHNAGAGVQLAAAQAHALFSEIHTGRRDAFGDQGHGYGDWNNYRWQAAKEAGVISGLHDIVEAQERGREAEETQLYGAPLKGADELIRRAAMQYKDRQ